MSRSPERVVCVEGHRAVPAIHEILNEGGEVELRVSGSSMSPVLKDGRDGVLLTAPGKTFRRYDILFFQREDGSYVLHRMVGRDRGGRLIMNGDAQSWTERIEPSQVIAVVRSIRRKGRWMECSRERCRLFAAAWARTRPFRPLIFRAWGMIASGVRRLSGRSRQGGGDEMR